MKHIKDMVAAEMALHPPQERAAKPTVDVVIRGACTGKRCPTVKGKALVDTGARDTFIDSQIVRQLHLKRLGSGRVGGITGVKTDLDLYGVLFSFPDLDLADVPVFFKGAYAKHQSGHVAILGRNAMAGGDDPSAGMRVEYDSPSGRLTLRPSKQKRGRRAP
jgi:Aspartyl protease